MSVAIACPHCNKLTKVDLTWAGHTVACPHCRQQFRIPDADAPEPTPGPLVDLDEGEARQESPRVGRPPVRRRQASLVLILTLVVLGTGGVPWLIWYLVRDPAAAAALAEEEEAKALLKKALDSWRLGDTRAKIAAQTGLEISDPEFASGAVLLAYDLGPARWVTGQVTGLQPGQVGCQIAVTLVRQLPDRREIKDNKQYLLARTRDNRWRLGDATPLRAAELGKAAPAAPPTKKPAPGGLGKATEDRTKEQARLEQEKKEKEEAKKQELARREADPRYWINFLTSQDEPTRTEARRKLAGMGESAVPALAQALDDDSDRVRQVAIELLGEVGPKAKAAVLPLRKLARRSPELRKPCEAALARIGPVAKGDLPVFLEALRYRDPELRRLAIEELQRFGPDAGEARPFLMEILSGEESPDLQREAIELLAQLPPKAAGYPVLVLLSKSSNTDLRVAAKQALQKLGPPRKEEAAELIALLKTARPEKRLALIESLRLAGAEARPALPVLLPLLDDGSPAVRRAALEFLIEFAADARPSLPVLLRLAKDDNSGVRSAAIRLLAKLGPVTAADVPVLVAALKDEDPQQRQVALEALEKLGPEAAAAVPALVERLAKAKEPPALKVLLIRTIAKLGPRAKVSSPTLMNVLKTDADESVRRAAADTLGGFGSDAVPELIEVVKEGNEQSQELAFHALALVGTPAVGPLVEALRESSQEKRTPLAKALGAIGAPAVPALRKAIKDSAFLVRMGACEALGCVGPKAVEAVPDLIDALRDDYTNVQRQAGRALEKIGQPAVPALVDAVRFSPKMRPRAVMILGQIGPAAKEAVPALTDALKDEDQQVRLEAEKALAKIRKK